MKHPWRSVTHERRTEWHKRYEAVCNEASRSAGICPVCAKAELRFFFWRHRVVDPDAGNKGGFWLWCPNCYTFEHLSALVPDWWRDIDGLSDESLNPEPEWLEENWPLILSKLALP
jgi:hypothetical protein